MNVLEIPDIDFLINLSFGKHVNILFPENIRIKFLKEAKFIVNNNLD
ncbi:hypothetical protein [Clostridium fermenticellae]|nr:hypothetical protein [Clostridium fermenticellae]